MMGFGPPRKKNGRKLSQFQAPNGAVVVFEFIPAPPWVK